MQKVNIVTNYFPPEIGAASNRIYNLAKGLKDIGYKVEVIAPLPNYPEGKIFNGYKGKFYTKEEVEGIIVRRFWVYPTVSKNFIIRFFGMVSFALTLWTGLLHYLKRKPDIMIVQHSPLLVSFSAMILGKLLPGCKRILNVSDLWPLTAVELGAMTDSGLMYRVMERIEHFNYHHSHLILGQSGEILQHIKDRTDKPLLLYRNISPEYSAQKINLEKYHEGRPKIVYAGLLGVAQGIYNLCQHIDFKGMGVEFHIYGSGNEEEKIRTYIENNPNSNIIYHGSVPREELHEKLPGFHASVVPLTNRIYGALPSKIFELISFGVPVLFCGGGEGAEIIRDNKLGLTSDPGDFKKLEDNIQRLKNLSEKEFRKILLNCIDFTKDKLNFKLQLQKLDQGIQKVK